MVYFEKISSYNRGTCTHGYTTVLSHSKQHDGKYLDTVKIILYDSRSTPNPCRHYVMQCHLELMDQNVHRDQIIYHPSGSRMTSDLWLQQTITLIMLMQIVLNRFSDKTTLSITIFINRFQCFVTKLSSMKFGWYCSVRRTGSETRPAGRSQ